MCNISTTSKEPKRKQISDIWRFSVYNYFNDEDEVAADLVQFSAAVEFAHWGDDSDNVRLGYRGEVGERVQFSRSMYF